MHPTFASGATSRAMRVARADATSSWCIAWYSCCSGTPPSGIGMPPLMKGACSSELISLKVNQYFTRAPKRSNSVRA